MCYGAVSLPQCDNVLSRYVKNVFIDSLSSPIPFVTPEKILCHRPGFYSSCASCVEDQKMI